MPLIKTQTPEEFARDMGQIATAMGAGLDMSMAGERCADLLQEGFAENFRAGASSEGEAWPARKDPGPQHPLLILSGVLAAAATHGNVREIGPSSVTSGVAVGDSGSLAGARRQQLGDQVAIGREGILPRPFIGASEEVLDACVDVLADAAVEVFA